MPYGMLADVVVVFHFLWIGFLILGGWWGRRYRWLGIIHISALVFALLVESFDWFCPLTYLEVWLRQQGKLAGYREAFISHYLNKIIYLDAPHLPIVLLTLTLCLVNGWFYLRVRRWR